MTAARVRTKKKKEEGGGSERSDVQRRPCCSQPTAGVILQEMTRNEDELPANVADEYPPPLVRLFVLFWVWSALLLLFFPLLC